MLISPYSWMSVFSHVSIVLSAGPGSSWPSSEHFPSIIPAELFQRPQDHPQNDVHNVV